MKGGVGGGLAFMLTSEFFNPAFTAVNWRRFDKFVEV